MEILAGLVVLLSIAASSCVVVGVNMLAGPAWAFITVGIILFGGAVYLRRYGLKPNG